MKQHLLKAALFICLFSNPMVIWEAQAQDCGCADSFEATVETYEENYSLFSYKVRDDNRALYRAHTDLMRDKARQTIGLQECKGVLEEWLRFFRDGHTYVTLAAKAGAEVKRSTYYEHIKVSEKQFKADYRKRNYRQNPLLGIWKSGDYTVALMPSPKGSKRKRDYVGVILESSNPNWKKDEVKFELTTDFGTAYQASFMMGDHSVRQVVGRQLNPAQLTFEGLKDWQKVWPEVEGARPITEIASRSGTFHIAYMEDIPYVRLPDFYSVDRAYVDSMMKAHHANLLQAEFIVVDVRGNSGGSDGTYFPVLPYILSGPVELPQSGFWLSEYNVRQLIAYRNGGKRSSVAEFTAEEKQEYDTMMARKGTAYFKYPDDYSFTFKPDTLYEGPKRVVVLTDAETASSGETFVFRARQSAKVVVYGQNTAGVVDGFNGLPKNIGCYDLVFPSSLRSMDLDKNPIDPYGIAPDVYLDKKADALAYAIAHMRQLIKNERGLP
ncbi:peptidase s41 [Pontibacter sp. HSC-14F20]|uniref:S41 family peptidase n=1 Tax=Pontibacter sp. HSC-14F20 TaxID=2864136 RepID=UPI001C735842|nr:S41 family peptidase [Pontibacter sp. HSC-14F20]MBX0335481.1 peptidase s41 [Pontibacter sp. HSC-14F20]